MLCHNPCTQPSPGRLFLTVGGSRLALEAILSVGDEMRSASPKGAWSTLLMRLKTDAQCGDVAQLGEPLPSVLRVLDSIASIT